MNTLGYTTQFENIKKAALQATKDLFPMERGGRVLEATSISVDDKLDADDYKSQKLARLNDQTWGVPVRANLRLVDKTTGKVVDEQKGIRLFVLPKATNRMSFIVGGNEYQVDNQLRRRPGIYTIRNQKGDLKSEVHVAKTPFNMTLDQESGLLKMNIGQGSVPLYPVLSYMGISDGTLAKAWGEDVLAANKAYRASKAQQFVRKAAKDLTKEIIPDSAPEAGEILRKHLETLHLDPEVMSKTLGIDHETVKPETLVVASQNLVHAQLRPETGVKPVERDSLEFKQLLSVEDFIGERLHSKMPEIKRKFERRLGMRKNEKIRDIVNLSLIGPTVEQFFTGTDLSQSTEQTNPVQMLNAISRVTIQGEGGVKQARAITPEMRALHPTQLGFIDPVHTPESSRIGAVMHLAVGAQKRGRSMVMPVIDVRTKKLVEIAPHDLTRSVVAFPDQYDRATKKFTSNEVKALRRGEHAIVDPSEVDYVIGDPKQVFSISSNLVPFLSSNSGGRALMASKMIEQAIPLERREAPLVQSKVQNRTFEDVVGSGFSHRSPVAGTVKSVGKGSVVISDEDGADHRIQTYDNLPLNGKAFLNSNATVKAGDKVKKGQLVADSNYTRGGTIALGTNLRVAYIPYKGYNFEDGVVITESAQAKLASEHMYQKYVRRDPNVKFNKKLFAAKFPVFSAAQLDKLDEEGIVKKGTILEPGDPYIAAIRTVQVSAGDLAHGKASTRLLRPERSAEETWNGITKAEVIDVVKTGDRVKVFMKTVEPAQIGDKLTGRHGNKGIITTIIPDDLAPRIGGKDGPPVEILLNPTGVIGRINIGQMLETSTAKIADKTGKPIAVENFSGADQVKEVRSLLDKAGLSDTEELYDPETNRNLGRVFTGKQYILKLSKQATTMFSARSWGAHTSGYDVNRSPLRGGEEGSKALDLLSLYAMLAHGSRANLKEMASIKAQQNDDFWRAYEQGYPLPPPKPSFVYQKFVNYLKGAGVNVEDQGSKKILAPMTDREVEHLSEGRTIREPSFIKANLKPEEGGFFDETLTGGLPERSGFGGERWSQIALVEPIPNPIMEAPIRQILNLDKGQFSNLIAGKLHFDPKKGELNSDGRGATGGLAFKAMLSGVDVDVKLKEAVEVSKSGKNATVVNNAHKAIRYLKALKEAKLSPEEAYLQSKIPVLPPIFRPIYPLPSGDLPIEGPNRLYQHVALVNKELEWQKSVPYMPESERSKLRLDLYKSVSALAGLTQPIAFFPEKRKPLGFINLIKGKGQAKEGFYQREVLRRNQDLVGRGTIIPEPKLGPDEVSLPRDIAWQVFKPFLIRNMVTLRGYSPADATKAWEDRTYVARAALDQVMSERPVLLNRAPTLHKFGIMAFRAKMHDDPNLKAIKIPPLIVKGFNADFDGDAMTVHVPVLPKAVEEAWRMLPSRNIYNPGTSGLMLTPSQEAVIGLHALSQAPSSAKAKANLKNIEEVEIAVNRGALKLNDVIDLAGETTTAGRALINHHLPESIGRVAHVLSGDRAAALYKEMATKEPEQYANIVDRLRELGDLHAYRSGFTVSLADTQPVVPEAEAVLREAAAGISKLRAAGSSQDVIDAAVRKNYTEADKKINAILETRLGEQGNRFYEMIRSKAKGNMAQLKQIVSAPLLLKDHRGETMPVPVTGNFSKGLPLSDYWTSLYAARGSAMDRQLQTEKPGTFNKYMMASLVPHLITMDDCGDSKGIKFDLKEPVAAKEVQDRYLAADVVHKGTVLAKKNEIITPALIADLKKHGVSDLAVRSPLTCTAPHGLCAMDYGLHDDGSKPEIGDNIGALSGQALSEPLTQMTMRTFHTGGVAGSGIKLSTFDKIDKILRMQKRLPGQARLADATGRIDKIEASSVKGGQNVYVMPEGSTDSVVHFVDRRTPLLDHVRAGAHVERGDALSKGIINPNDLVNRKGMLPAMEYTAKTITDSYHGEGIPLRQRAVETVVRALGSLTRVVDPGDSAYSPNEIAPYHVVEQFNRTAGVKMPLDDAEGLVLTNDHGTVKAGTKITPRIRKLLEELGHTHAVVGPRPIGHLPQLTGIKRLPVLRSDWMAQMGYGHIAQAVREGAAQRTESDIHGYSPVPAFAYANEFGEGEAGAY